MSLHHSELTREHPRIRVITVRKEGNDEKLELIDPLMSIEDYAKAKKSRERLEASYPDTMEETDESKVKGRELRRIERKEERKKEMANKNKKKQKGGTPKAEKKSKAKYTDKNKPPAVEKGKQAVWHDGYSYENLKGTKITVTGHWEVIKIPDKPNKPETPK